MGILNTVIGRWSEHLSGEGLCVTPLLGKLHDSSGQLNDEICLVSQQLLTAGQKVLPPCKAPKRRRKWYKDQVLSCLAACKIYGSCVSSGGAPTPLAHRCSKFHTYIKCEVKT